MWSKFACDVKFLFHMTINNFHVKQNCSTFGTLVTYIFSHSQCESHISSTIFPNVNNDQGFWRILAVCRFRKCWPHRKLAATAFSQMLHGSSTADSFHRNLFRRQPLKPEPFLKAFLYKICNLKVQEMEIFQFASVMPNNWQSGLAQCQSCNLQSVSLYRTQVCRGYFFTTNSVLTIHRITNE